MAMNVTPFIETDGFNMATFNNMITQINNGVDNEVSELVIKIENGVKIAIGSYSGTGKSGHSYPNSLTFDFEPKFVHIMSSSEGYDSNRLTLIRGCTKAAGGQGSTSENTIAWSGNTVSWYSGVGLNDYIPAQLNSSGTTYRYFAIG